MAQESMGSGRMTYKFVMLEDWRNNNHRYGWEACDIEEYRFELFERLIAERDAYREIAIQHYQHGYSDEAQINVDAEAERIIENKTLTQ